MQTTDIPTPKDTAGQAPAKNGSRFAADDARLVHLRGGSTKQLITILAESVSDDIAISPIYFALGTGGTKRTDSGGDPRTAWRERAKLCDRERGAAMSKCAKSGSQQRRVRRFLL